MEENVMNNKKQLQQPGQLCQPTSQWKSSQFISASVSDSSGNHLFQSDICWWEIVGMELCGGVLSAISDMFRPEALLTISVNLFSPSRPSQPHPPTVINKSLPHYHPCQSKAAAFTACSNDCQITAEVWRSTIHRENECFHFLQHSSPKPLSTRQLETNKLNTGFDRAWTGAVEKNQEKQSEKNETETWLRHFPFLFLMLSQTDDCFLLLHAVTCILSRTQHYIYNNTTIKWCLCHF